MFAQAVRRAVTPRVVKSITAAAGVSVASLATYQTMRTFNPKAKAETQVDLKHGGLSPDQFLPFTLSDVQLISSDSALYFFSLATPTAKLNMPITSYVLAKADVDGEQIIRPYTPIIEVEGEMPLLIKTYPNGKMGNAFSHLEIGQTMLFKGPLKKYDYNTNEFDRITLVAGGSGITPCFQILEHIVNNPNDKTQVHLLYGNRSTEDILLKPILDDLAITHSDKFKVSYIIDRPEQGWTGMTGYVTPEVVSAIHGAPGNPRAKVFVCGPPPMMEAVCGPKGPNYTQGVLGNSILGQLGFNESEVYKF